jgi:hypothetical protein
LLTWLTWLALSTGSTIAARSTSRAGGAILTRRSVAASGPLRSTAALRALFAPDALGSGIAVVADWTWLTRHSRQTYGATLALSTSKTDATG